MKNITISSLSFVAFLLIFGCSQDNPKKKLSRNLDTSFLNDTNFIYKNVKNTLELKFTGKTDVPNGSDVDSHLYTDSTYKRKFVELTALQKTKLIAPFISKEMHVNYKYPRDLMQAYFISKQNKIGDLQPIIIKIDGDDYSSLAMIVLNTNNKPVDGVNLEGGFNAGPNDVGNDMMEYEAKSYSTIDAGKITTYRINHTDCTNDSLKKPTTVDSMVYVSVIDKSGKIRTKLMLNKQYQVPYKSASK